MEFSKTEGVHDAIVVNDDLDTAYKELEEFIFKGEGAGERVDGGETR